MKPWLKGNRCCGIRHTSCGQCAFRLPHRPHLRPAWMIRTGLFLYDHLAKREILPGSRSITFDEKDPLKSDITKGFEYSDGWVDDARLVVLTAKKAQECGATILTRTKCINAERGADSWNVSLQDMNDDSVHQRFRQGDCQCIRPLGKPAVQRKPLHESAKDHSHGQGQSYRGAPPQPGNRGLHSPERGRAQLCSSSLTKTSFPW